MTAFRPATSYSTLRKFDLYKDGGLRTPFADATAVLDTRLALGDPIYISLPYFVDTTSDLTLIAEGQMIEGIGRSAGNSKAALFAADRTAAHAILTVAADQCSVRDVYIGQGYKIAPQSGSVTYNVGTTVNISGDLTAAGWPNAGTVLLKGDGGITQRPAIFKYTSRTTSQFQGVTWIYGRAGDVFPTAGTLQLLSSDGSVSPSDTGAAHGPVGIALGQCADFVGERIVFANCYDCFDAGSGYTWHLDECRFNDPYRYGMRERDAGTLGPDLGDSDVTNCTFKSIVAGSTAMHFESGGGMKITGNKAFGWARHIDVQPLAGVQTSIILLAANSLEGAWEENVRIGDYAGTGGLWDLISIGQSNQFQTMKQADRGLHIGLNSTTVFIGGIWRGQSGGTIQEWCLADNGTAKMINPGAVDGYNGVGLHIGAAAQLVKYRRGIETNLTQPIKIDSEPTGGKQAAMDLGDFYLQINNVTDSSGWQSAWEIALATNDAIYVELFFHGRLTGPVNGFGRVIRGHLVRGNGAATFTSIEDSNNGAAIDFQWDLATVSGSGIPQIRRSSGGGGTALIGNAEMLIRGRPAYVKNPTTVGSGHFSYQ